MGIRDWLRNLISGPPHIDDARQDDPGEFSAAMQEESAVPQSAADDSEPETKPEWDFPGGGRRP